MIDPLKDTAAEKKKFEDKARKAGAAGQVQWDVPWKSRTVILGNTNPGGLIPMWVVNFVCDKAPPKWVPQLQKACDQFMEKNNIHRHDPDIKLKLRKLIDGLYGKGGPVPPSDTVINFHA